MEHEDICSVYTQIACYMYFHLVTLLVTDALNNSVYKIF